MKRHVFDPISAFFGVLILGTAVAVTLADDRVVELEARWLWPVIVIVAGVMLLGSSLRRAEPDDSGSDDEPGIE